MDRTELSKRWREQSKAYYDAVNDYVERGNTQGWENMEGEAEPNDPREPIADDVIAAVREANARGEWQTLREQFPPAHGPFIKYLEEGGQSIPVIAQLVDGRIIALIGTPYQDYMVVLIDGDSVSLIPDVITFGRSPDRTFWALAFENHIEIRATWDGPALAKLSYPTGLEGMPAEIKIDPLEGNLTITQLIPFPDGKRVLLVSPSGIFVLAEEEVRLLYPPEEETREAWQYQIEDDPEDTEYFTSLSMEHGAVSPDGKLIAVGCQDSKHLIFDENLNLVGDVGNICDYPHYALFNSNSSMVAINSCHFYNGITIGVKTSQLPGLETESYEEDKRIVTLDDQARVYAAVHRLGEFIIGDANGYLRSFDETGKQQWQHFIGSSIGDIDVSPDGKTLIVSTYAGFLCVLDMDTGEKDPFTIGTSKHRERRRWIFWKTDTKPLIW